MCGIAGSFLKNPSADAAAEERCLTAALDQLRHRGPDDMGSCGRATLLMGHRRLSILDLSDAGHQPMVSADGRFTVVLNGEIYNYLELRSELERHGHVFRTRTDTEVLLHAYSEWAAGSLNRFRGMFAFALWDERARRLLLARDRMGEKPLYYSRDAERVVFASEIKALLELMPSRPVLSADAVATFLHYQFVVEPDTPLEGVLKLPAAHVLEISANDWTAEPKPYWSMAAIPPIDGDPTRVLRERLESAVELTLRSDAPVGLTLSGGLDSAVIAALASRARPDLMAFTVGYPGARDFDERQDARALAALLKIPWHSAELGAGEFVSFFPELVRSLDEPIADLAAYGQYAVAKLAAEHGVKVLLTGIGGDELFFGYGWVIEALRLSRMKMDARARDSSWDRMRARLLRRALHHPALLNVAANRRLPGWWRRRVEHAFDYGRLDLDHPDEWVFYQLDYHWEPAQRFSREVLAGAFLSRLSPRAPYRFMQGMDGAGRDAQVGICRLLFDSWLVSNCLALGDRVSMASSVETRVPLLETALVEGVIGLWNAGRTDDSRGHKLWLRAVAADLLPREVLDRPKRGFITPTVEWMEGVNTRYRPHLVSGSLVESGVLDGDRLRRWIGHAGPNLHRDFFQYKLTLLEIWNRLILQRQTPDEIRDNPRA